MIRIVLSSQNAFSPGRADRRKTDGSWIRAISFLAIFSGIFGLFSCASLPEPKFTAYSFPEQDVFVDGKPARPYKVIGPVRVRVNYASLNPERDEQELCRNSFNKGARDLLKRARRDMKADAVIKVRSVVYYMDGKSKSFPSPECSDDGGEGQILMEGRAIRYLPDPKKPAKKKS